jgi:hypothetical protein
MINALKRNNSKFLLIAKINGLSSESKKVRKRLLKLKVDEHNYHLLCRKLLIGNDSRYHLLAYAFLRGKPYSLIEQNCREDNQINTQRLFEIIQFNAPTYIPYDSYDKTGGGSYSVKEEDVAMWLKGEEK